MSREKKYKRPRGQGSGDTRGTGLMRHPGSTFVMTLWLEPRSVQEDPEWRWRVIQVQTGERRYFRRLSDLLAYVSNQTGVRPPALNE